MIGGLCIRSRVRLFIDVLSFYYYGGVLCLFVLDV